MKFEGEKMMQKVTGSRDLWWKNEGIFYEFTMIFGSELHHDTFIT